MSKLLADRALLRDAVIMQGAAALSFVVAYLFHVYMGRSLGPAEYGLLGTLLAILYPIAIPLHTVQNTLAKLVASAIAHRRHDQVSPIMAQSLRKVGLLSLAVAAIMLAASPLGASLLSVNSPWALIMMAAIIPPLCLLAVGRGVLQGLLSFYWLGLNLIVEKVSELGLGVVLVSWGLGATAGMTAYALGAILTLIMVLFPLRGWRNQPPQSSPTAPVDLLGHGWPIFLAIVLVTLMSSVDLLLVRFLLPAVESGYYAAVSMVGKVTFLSALALAGVLFPTTTKLRIQGQGHLHVLWVGLAFIGLAGGGLISFGVLAPVWVMGFLFGADYLAAAPLLAPYTLALGLLSLSVILIYYHLALERYRFLIFLGGAALGEVALLVTYHSSALEIVWSLVVIFSLLLLANVIYLVGALKQSTAALQPAVNAPEG